MTTNRTCQFLVAAAVSLATMVSQALASDAGVPHPRIYQLGVNDVAGWTVTNIHASRRESDWRAWNDSRDQSRYFYGGSWNALGRVTGWFEALTLSQGIARAQTVVLVSEFPSAAVAQRAYQRILPATTALVSLPIGTRAEQWQTNAGVASGPLGLAGYFGGYTTYLQAGAAVVEIHADIAGAPGTVLRPPLPNPGRAIARRLAKVASARVP